MSFSVYDMTVPTMIHGLGILDTYLDLGREWERLHGLDAGAVLAAKLAPDMLSFGEQINVSCNKVELHVAKLAQRPRSAAPAAAVTYLELRSRIFQAHGFLTSIQPDELTGAETRTYELSPPIVRGWFGGDDYIRHLVLPDFFFHIATAHAILRHVGLSIGKRDYLGNLSQQSGGDYS